MSSLNDLGHFDQAVWGTLNGNVLLNSDLFSTSISRLGIHFDPILFFFVPLYAIWPDVTWFTLAQAVAISLSAWPIFLFAKDVTRSEEVAFAWSLAYLINPYLLNASAWEFHPVSLAVPFIALGMLAIERKNFKLLVLSSLFILLCKEHFGIMIVGFGALWWLRNKSLKKSALLVSIGCLHFIVVLKFIMPLFSPTGEHLMLSQDLGQLSRYSWMGDSLNEITKNLFLNPLAVLKTATFELGGGGYLLLLFLLFLGMPLLGFEFMLPGLADLAANFLSATPMPKTVFAYHSVTLIPVLACAALYGVKRLSRSGPKLMMCMAAGILAVNLGLGYLLSPFPLPQARNIWAPNQFLNLPDTRVNEIHSIISREKSVSAQANVGSHFSQRKEIYLYPNKVGDADFLVLRLENPTKYVYASKSEPDEIFIQHFQIEPEDYMSSIREIIRGNEYSIIYWNEPWLVFAKDPGNHRVETDIEATLKELESEWKSKVKDGA